MVHNWKRKEKNFPYSNASNVPLIREQEFAAGIRGIIAWVKKRRRGHLVQNFLFLLFSFLVSAVKGNARREGGLFSHDALQFTQRWTRWNLIYLLFIIYLRCDGLSSLGQEKKSSLHQPSFMQRYNCILLHIVIPGSEWGHGPVWVMWNQEASLLSFNDLVQRL